MSEYEEEGSQAESHSEGGVAATDITEDEILDLLQEMREKAAEDDCIRDEGLMIEALTINTQRRGLTNMQHMLQHMPENTSGAVQLLHNLILTWGALMTKDRPSAYAVPTSDDLANRAAAEVATALIEYIEQEETVTSKWHQSAIYAGMHGTGLMRIVYDPKIDRVMWEPLSIFDCWLQPATARSGVKWCVIRSYIDKYDAKELGDFDDLPSETQYVDGRGVTRHGVEKWEIWHLPSARYKKGLYACVVDNKVIEAMDYPYTFSDPDGENESALLPVTWWSARPARSTVLGTTWATDCAPIQATINKLSAKALADALAARQLLILPSSLQNTDMIDHENAVMYLDVNAAQQSSMIKWIQPAPLDPHVNGQIENLFNNIFYTAGLSQTTLGQDERGSQSGRALAYQAELDANKHAQSYKDFEIAQTEAWELTLKLIQKYYVLSRQIQITGMEEAISFSGADIHGISVRLEQRSERESTAAVKKQNIKDDVMAGIADPSSIPQGGLQDAASEVIAEKVIDDLLSGQDIQITPESLPPEVIIKVVDKRIHRALLNQDMETVIVLQNFKKQYMMMLGQAGEEAPPEASAGGEAPQAPETSPVIGDESVFGDGG
jgi:hypothetical protein